MSAPAWILTRREAELWRVWQERMHEIFEDEGGKPLSFAGDAIPVLVGLIHEHYPKAKTRRRLELIGKLVREQYRQTAGEA
jgi:hypothetical protein